MLLKSAIAGNYAYYHLLSGHDLPIKNSEYILHFFGVNAGREFISIYRPAINPDNLRRLSRYEFHFKSWTMTRISRFIQEQLRIDRTRNVNWEYMKGSNWFSITHRLAKHVLECEPIIRKRFSYVNCADEIFLQTIAYNSDFKNEIYSDCNDIQYRVKNCEKTMGNMRTMDWPDDLGTAHPRVLTIDDFDWLSSSDALFARKFDSEIDSGIIHALESRLLD